MNYHFNQPALPRAAKTGNMRTDIYNAIKALGFIELTEARKENKRLGILKSYVFRNLYCEVIPRDWGLSIQISGGKFQNGMYPSNYDVTNKADIEIAIAAISEKL